MKRDTSALIAELAGELEPVRPLRDSRGLALAAGGLAASVAVVVMVFGLRADLAAGSIDALFLVANGLFLLLGAACAVTAITMSRPRVGSDHTGWIWAAAMAALLPLSGAMVGAMRGAGRMAAGPAAHGLDCLVLGTVLGLASGGALVWWLRQGAPTSPERAGLLTGIAAGCFGMFAYSLHCSDSDIVHIGFWHSAVVIFSALAGRLFVPRLVRW